MSSRLASHLLGLVAVGASAAMVSAQGLLVWNGQVLATNGDAVPGVAGATFGGSSTFDSGVLDDQGNVLFRGRIGNAPLIQDRGLFYGGSKGELALIVRSGDLEPSGTVPGATMNTASGTGIGGSYRISSNGWMLFGASLFDGNVNVNTSNDTALYHGRPGAWQILVREGQAAPGTAGATISSSFSSPSTQNTGLNAQGRAFFLATLVGGDVVGTTNNSALYTGTPGNLQLVARKGDVAPGGEILAGVAPGFVTQMNAAGQIVFDVSFVVGSGTFPVDASNDRALWMYTPGVGVQQLLREGDPAPVAGATYGASSWSINTGSCTFNALGQMLIRTDIQGPSITTGVDDLAIVRVSLAGHQLIAQRGEAAPGIPGATFDIWNNVSVLQNDGGTVAFQATVRGGSITSADNGATYVGTPGNWTLVVREGDAAPGTGGGVFGDPSGRSHLLNGSDQLLMTLDVSGGTNAGSSLWSYDPIVGLQPQVLAGSTIEAQPGVFRPFGSQGGIQFNNGGARPLSFANDGTYTVRISFNDNVNSAVVKSRLGSLYAAPTRISTTTGGTQHLYLNAGAANAGNTYFVLGSISGTAPGFPFGSVTVPLNPDTFTLITLTYPNAGPFGNTLGTLDAEGRALSTITIPAIGQGAGLTIDWAYIALDNLLNPTFASQSDELITTL